MINTRKSRVLIIDDNQDIHGDIKKILCQPAQSNELDALVQDITGHSESDSLQLDIQVDSALQGEEGIAMVRQAIQEGDPYALVYVDIRIPPGLDGVETIKQLQLEDINLQYIIITAYSDYSWHNIREELSPGDNLLILKKPFESIEILQSTNALLEKWHLAREHEKASEELLRIKKMETVAVMAGGIAHDFNNLLMGIAGNIELATLQMPRDHSSLEFLQHAMESVKETEKLTKKFRLFAKYEVFSRSATSLRDLIATAANGVFAESNIICEFHLSDNLWLADIDSEQIDHVLREVFRNAEEAMAGDGRVIITAENILFSAEDHPDKKEGKYIQVVVEDEGCGIEEKNLPKIFDPYFSSKSRGFVKGMGLGLSIVAAIVNQHEGYVHVDSSPGVGTTVYIDLPAADN